MKKLLLLVLIVGGLVYAYYWYVLGVNLLLNGDDAFSTASYASFAVRLPVEGGGDTADVPAWTVAAPMPTARTYVTASAVNGTVYVMGGIDKLARTLDVVEAFDTEKNTWAIVAPMPKALHHAASVAVGGKIYVFGGMEGLSFSPVNDAFVYDPEKNEWSSIAPIPEPLGGTAAVSDGVTIHLLGGATLGGTTDAHYVYDLATGTWSDGEPLIAEREQHGAAMIDGALYVVGGRQGNLAYTLNTLEVYRPSQREWERWESMAHRRSGVAVTSYGGRIWVFGGEAPTVTFNDAESYDPTARAWTTLEPMPTARQGAGVAEAGGRIFVIGGGVHPGISVSDVNEVFTP